MGCGSSAPQFIKTKEGIFKLQQILAANSQKQENTPNGRIYLFGETRTQRKIIECQTKLNAVKIISNKTRIPCPKINQDPLESIYEQSQQVFHLGAYGFSMLPPFNNMLALYLQSNVIFMCGGRDYDHYNVKNEVFFYSAEDNKIMSQMSSTNELSSRLETRPKYARSRFQKMASMRQKRHSHMGIYLNKLKSVLVFGGMNDKDQTLASCEIYNILQNVWNELPSMKVPKAGGNCFEYANKVYLFGGRTNQVKLSKKIEVFSLEQSTWTLLKIRIHRGIENALVFSQAPNQLLIVGGATHFYNCKTVIKVNLNQQTYVWDSQLNKEYSHIKGIKVGQDLIVFGGQKDTCQIFNQKKWKVGLLSHRKCIDIDELQDFSFTQQSLVIKQADSQSKQHICLEEENVFFGSDDFPCLIFYNWQTGKIRKGAVPMALRLKKNMEVVQLPKKVYMLLGGCDRQNKKISRSCFMYDAKQNKAIQSVKMSEKKINFAAVYFQNQVYVFGGFNPAENAGQINCQKFNLQQQKWIEVRTLNKPKYITFAQRIGENKIAVLGKQYKNSPVTQIQIYHTKRDCFDTFALKSAIPDKISMVYAVEQENKIVILREDESNNIEEIEITEQKLIEKEQQRQSKQIEKQEQNMAIQNTLENEQHSQHNSIPDIRQSKQKKQTEYESSQLHRNNIMAMRPRLVEIKPIKCDSQQDRVQEQEDSSFQVEKIEQQNKAIVQTHQQDFKRLRVSQKFMPENPHLQDDVHFSLDNHSFEANLSSLKYKQSITQKKQGDLISLQKIELSSRKQSEKHSIKQYEDNFTQKHNIIKRQNQLFFFNQNEVIHFDLIKKEKTIHRIQSQVELRLLHLV